MRILNVFRKDEKGQGMVEYGLILALVSVVAVGALGGVGEKVTNNFSVVNDPETLAKIEDGYIPIATADELNNIRNNATQTFGEDTIWENDYESTMSGKYILVSDIDLGEFDNWEPIGTGVYSYFSGTFDGGGHVIKNLAIDRVTSHIGLFGYVRDAFFNDIKLIDIHVQGNRYVGGLVGIQYGSTIKNSYASGTVTGVHSVGGLVGWQNYTLLSESASVADVEGHNHVGGLVGYQEGRSEIINSHSMGKVSGEAHNIGGLSGFNNGSTIDSSYSIGKVTSNNKNSVGGLLGRSVGLVVNSFWANDVGSDENNHGDGMEKQEVERLIAGLIHK